MESANERKKSGLFSRENSVSDSSAPAQRPLTRRSKMKINFEKKLSKLKALASKADVTQYKIFSFDRISSERKTNSGRLELEPQVVQREEGYLLHVDEVQRFEPNDLMTEDSTMAPPAADLTTDLVEKDVRALGIFPTEEEEDKAPNTGDGPEPTDPKDCGILSFRPSLIQPLANIKVFILFMSVLISFQQGLMSGYSSSVVTTIEKRYGIPSYLIGVISSATDVGNIISVILVSYLGSRRKIPVWIAAGCLLVGIGSFLFMVPQLTSERWTLKGGQHWNQTETKNLCWNNRMPEESFEEYENTNNNNNNSLQDDDLSMNGRHRSQNIQCFKKRSSPLLPVSVFVLSYLLIGVGGSPLLTLGCTYIDDHVTKKNSPFCIGILYTMAGFGPVLGFLLGAYLLSFYVDTFFVPKSEYSEIDQKHPRWIGMWWGGFLIFGVIISLLSLPFFMFPKTIQQEKEKVRLKEKSERTKSQTSTSSRRSTRSVYGKNIKEIPAAMIKLLFNSIFFVTCLGSSFEFMIVAGFILFIPKYMETQFSLSSVHAAIYTGGIAIPGGCIGILLGGYLMKRYDMGSKGAIQMALVSNLICLSLYGSLFALGCKNFKMAGATSPYSGFSNSKANGVVDTISKSSFKANLTEKCNVDCSCTNNFIEPVCGNNGLTYFSPCHAGCSYTNAYNFTNCSCITEDLTNNTSIDVIGNEPIKDISVATVGTCNRSCKIMAPFLAVLFFMTLFVAINQMPLMMVALRSVKEEERCFALGLRFVIFRLLAYIPAPIIFGTVIDSSCLLWREFCEGERGGKCIFYDIEKRRYRIIGFCSGIKVLSTLIFLFDWFLIKRKCQVDVDQTITVGEMIHSSMSFIKEESDYEVINESLPSSPESPQDIEIGCSLSELSAVEEESREEIKEEPKTSD